MGSVIMSNQIKKAYNPSLGSAETFFVPHKDSNHLNAQDVIHSLVAQSLSATTVTWLMLEEQDGRMVNTANSDLVANMLWDIQTKLEMITKILPMAFDSGDNKKAVAL